MSHWARQVLFGAVQGSLRLGGAGKQIRTPVSPEGHSKVRRCACGTAKRRVFLPVPCSSGPRAAEQKETCSAAFGCPSAPKFVSVVQPLGDPLINHVDLYCLISLLGACHKRLLRLCVKALCTKYHSQVPPVPGFSGLV